MWPNFNSRPSIKAHLLRCKFFPSLNVPLRYASGRKKFTPRIRTFLDGLSIWIKTHLHGCQGFTLLEVMIAISILAAMSLAMFGATNQIVGSKDAVEARDEAQHSIVFALQRMVDDIGMAYIVRAAEMLGNPNDIGEVAFEGGEDRLDFVSFSHLRYLKGAPESESCEVSYYLANDPQAPESQILMRRESAVIDKNLQGGGRAYPLLENVRALRFEYLPSKSDEWRKVWDSKSISSENRLPRAVKIEVEVLLPDEEAPKTFSTIALVRLKEPLAF